MKSTKVRFSGFWFVCYKCSLAWDLCAFKSLIEFRLVQKTRLGLDFVCVCVDTHRATHIHTYIHTLIHTYIKLRHVCIYKDYALGLCMLAAMMSILRACS